VPAIISVGEDVRAKLSEPERQRVAELVEAISDAYVPDTGRALSHEGWHQYFHMYTVSWVAMPSWLDEGVGDYFYMATATRRQARGTATGWATSTPTASARCGAPSSTARPSTCASS
jgi:hypothetical protein